MLIQGFAGQPGPHPKSEKPVECARHRAGRGQQGKNRQAAARIASAASSPGLASAHGGGHDLAVLAGATRKVGDVACCGVGRAVRAPSDGLADQSRNTTPTKPAGNSARVSKGLSLEPWKKHGIREATSPAKALVALDPEAEVGEEMTLLTVASLAFRDAAGYISVAAKRL